VEIYDRTYLRIFKRFIFPVPAASDGAGK